MPRKAESRAVPWTVDEKGKRERIIVTGATLKKGQGGKRATPSLVKGGKKQRKSRKRRHLRTGNGRDNAFELQGKERKEEKGSQPYIP